MSISTPINIFKNEDIISLLENLTLEFYKQDNSFKKRSLKKINGLATLVKILHFTNYKLWNCEAKIRDIDVSVSDFIRLKRDIDDMNLYRNSCVERIDELLYDLLKLEQFKDWNTLYINSETIGQIIDTLSILTLKIFYRKNIKDYRGSEIVSLKIQRDYVVSCYIRYFNKLVEGKGYMPKYYQFKTYKNSSITNRSYDLKCYIE